MNGMAENETGYPYGTVLEHPFIRGLFYMVVCGGPRPGYNEMRVLVLREANAKNTGQIVICNGYQKRDDQYDWIIIDD